MDEIEYGTLGHGYPKLICMIVGKPMVSFLCNYVISALLIQITFTVGISNLAIEEFTPDNHKH